MPCRTDIPSYARKDIRMVRLMEQIDKEAHMPDTQETLSARLGDTLKKSNEAYMAYRTAKAAKFLELACPPDGAKKPTEKVIDATIDSDANLMALKRASLEADAALEVARFEAKASLSRQDN